MPENVAEMQRCVLCIYCIYILEQHLNRFILNTHTHSAVYVFCTCVEKMFSLDRVSYRF